MKIAMIFPGYGSQFVGMGKELYDDYRIVQEYFEEASSCLNLNFVKLCFASSDADLGKMSNAYPALFLVSSAICSLLKEKGIEPQMVAGYNQGEYAAIFAAGGLTLPDGLYLLTKYSTIYQDALESLQMMRLIKIQGLPAQTIEEICLQASDDEHRASIAIYHDSLQQYVVGDLHALEYVRELVMHIMPDVLFNEVSPGFGFHALCMNNVVDQFKMYLEKVDCRDLKIPLVSGIDGTLLSTGAAVKQHLIEHINHPVRWPLVIDSLATADVILEIGPGTLLSNLVKKYYPAKVCMAINKETDIQMVLNVVGAHH